jgi:two-component system, chemotaxis family, sensor kinase CheA
MSLDREALQKRLLASFKVEADERLGALADSLANWRETHASEADFEVLFREVHSLKGAARAVGLRPFERICHAWESLLGEVRAGHLKLTSERVELCRYALRILQKLHNGQASEDEQQALIEHLDGAAHGEAVSAPVSPPSAPVAPSDPGTLRVSARRLDALLFHNETLLQHKLEASDQARQLSEHRVALEPQRGHRLVAGFAVKQLRESAQALPAASQDTLRAVLEHLEWSQAQMDRLHFEAIRLEKAGKHLSQGLTLLSDALGEELQGVLLLAGSRLTDGLPAMVQDLASQAGKRVTLQITGNELQVDKRILDELRTPLTHLLRNAVDHGLETPAQRSACGKPEVGSLHLEFLQESADRFELRLRDDGRGLDIAKLKARAVASGLLDGEQAQALSDAEAGKLIFASGLSTSALITDLSGRGLGMAIVQEAVERIGGRIEVESEEERGTCVRLHLPLNLSTFRAVIVRNAERIFALPALAVERCLRLPASAVKTQENRPTLVFQEQVMPVWALSDVLALDSQINSEGNLTVLLLKVRGERFFLLVDELLGDQEITVKSLGKQLPRVRNLLGATLLGDGQLVPILHPGDLFRSAQSIGGGSFERSAERVEPQAKQRLLIAEDSFTSRGLLKAILEGAGYLVSTANDGLEAWNALKQSRFDLLVSDVEMPRMDGFTLTSRIRLDRELAHLPVVLVTALHSAEDRAHGLEVGANAYLVKSGFEQDSLLDAIRRLI